MSSDPELLQKAKEAWIAYSTPLWRGAGRSEAWIAQNIIDEWATSQDDIVRRYLAGDFGLPINGIPHLTYRAEGYNEIFLFDEFGRLRWFPNPQTWWAYGYEYGQENVVPISWFYDKPIVESITDALTGQCYEPEDTPNYELYIRPIVPVYTCPHCPDTFGSQEELDAHIASAHPTVYSCPQCGATFGSQEELDNHITAVHTVDPELLQKAKEAWIAYSTPLWRRAGRSEAWIAQKIIDEWATSQDDIVRRYLAGDFSLLYSCPYCAMTFGSQAELDTHISTVHTVDPELLQKAKEAWIAYSTPLWRRAGRSEAWIAQNIIDEWATSQDDIVRRYLAGDFTLLYSCPYCAMTFGSQAELDTHISTVHVAGIPDWFRENWKVLAIGGSILGVGITAAVVAGRRKK